MRFYTVCGSFAANSGRIFSVRKFLRLPDENDQSESSKRTKSDTI